MPAPADYPIRAMKQWVATYTPRIGKLPPPLPLERSTLLDRWAQHGQHCYHCQRAVDGIAIWRRRAVFTLALALLASRHLVARFVAAASVLALGALSAVRAQFEFQDFKHYRNH